LEFRDADPLKAESDSQKAADKLKLRIETENRRQTELIGPVPAFFSKVDGIHRWQIILRGPDPASLLSDLKLSDCRVEVDPISLL
jgi:primosomal protein N' (replication factor Y)